MQMREKVGKSRADCQRVDSALNPKSVSWEFMQIFKASQNQEPCRDLQPCSREALASFLETKKKKQQCFQHTRQKLYARLLKQTCFKPCNTNRLFDVFQCQHVCVMSLFSMFSYLPLELNKLICHLGFQVMFPTQGDKFCPTLFALPPSWVGLTHFLSPYCSSIRHHRLRLYHTFHADAWHYKNYSYGNGWGRIPPTATERTQRQPCATIWKHCRCLLLSAAIPGTAALPRFPVPVMERIDAFIDFDGGPSISWATNSDQFSARSAKREPSIVLSYGRPVPAVGTAYPLGHPEPRWVYRLVSREVWRKSSQRNGCSFGWLHVTFPKYLSNFAASSGSCRCSSSRTWHRRPRCSSYGCLRSHCTARACHTCRPLDVELTWVWQQRPGTWFDACPFFISPMNDMAVVGWLMWATGPMLFQQIDGWKMPGNECHALWRDDALSRKLARASCWKHCCFSAHCCHHGKKECAFVFIQLNSQLLVFLFRLSLFEHVFLVFTVSRRYCPCSVILRGGCNVDLKHCVFPIICGSGGSKNRLAKAVGAEPAGQMRDEKLHAVVARSTFRSQKVQNTPHSDHFWKLRCRKSARRSGAKHISKSKCTKHTTFGSLLEVEMSKKCMPLWREAHFQVKMHKTHHCRTTFGSWDVEKAHAVVARSTFRSENAQNTPRSDHFWKLRCRKSARRCGGKHISKSKC